MRGCEGLHHGTLGQRLAFDFQYRDIHRAVAVAAIAPQTLALVIERHGEAGRGGEIIGVGVQFDFDTIGMMFAVGIQQHVTAGDQKQALINRVEETTGRGQHLFVVKGPHPRGAEQQGIEVGRCHRS